MINELVFIQLAPSFSLAQRRTGKHSQIETGPITNFDGKSAEVALSCPHVLVKTKAVIFPRAISVLVVTSAFEGWLNLGDSTFDLRPGPDGGD